MKFIFWFLLVCLEISKFVYSQPLKIVVPSDFVVESGQAPDFLAGKLLMELQKRLQGKVEFDLRLASRNREWRLLEQRDNVCLYNKRRTPEREVVAHFSQLPLVIFPPNRLILRKISGQFFDRISLQEAVSKYGLNIGVVEGRSYGNMLDMEVKALGSQLFINGGEFNAERLFKILQQNRLDGVIEYTKVFQDRLGPKDNIDNYQVIPLDEASEYSYGYIACSRSEVGEKVVELIDQGLRSSLMKGHTLSLHKQTFPIIEYTYIKQEFEGMWQFIEQHEF